MDDDEAMPNGADASQRAVFSQTAALKGAKPAPIDSGNASVPRTRSFRGRTASHEMPSSRSPDMERRSSIIDEFNEHLKGLGRAVAQGRRRSRVETTEVAVEEGTRKGDVHLRRGRG